MGLLCRNDAEQTKTKKVKRKEEKKNAEFTQNCALSIVAYIRQGQVGTKTKDSDVN